MNKDFFAKRYIAKFAKAKSHMDGLESVPLLPSRPCRIHAGLPGDFTTARTYQRTAFDGTLQTHQAEQAVPFFPLPFQCCFTCTETLRLRLVRDREPRTSTSTFTQLLSSDPYSVLPLSLISHMVSVGIKHHERKSRLCSTLQASFSGGWMS